MKPATPLPWYQAGDNELGEGVLGQGSGEYIAIMSDDRNPADYDYLIHAVNAYPKLITFLKNAASNGGPRMAPLLREQAEQAENLLLELGEM